MMRGKYDGKSTGKKYKNRDLYVCLALNRLVRALDIDVSQDGLEQNLDALLYHQHGLPKNTISNEIKTNYKQTNKVITFLRSKGFVTVEASEKAHLVKITKEGVLFIRRSNGYFAETYADLIQQPYRYTRLPAWFRTKVGST